MRPTAGRASTFSWLPTPPPPPAAAAESVTEVPPWQWPVPYVYGPLAGLAGLIALSLLILACSYWKLHHYLGFGREPSTRPRGGFPEVMAVVMAGDRVPSFLAAPAGRRAAALDAGGSCGERPAAEENSGRKAGGESSAVAAQPEAGGD